MMDWLVVIRSLGDGEVDFGDRYYSMRCFTEKAAQKVADWVRSQDTATLVIHDPKEK